VSNIGDYDETLNLAPYFERCDDPCEIWEGLASKRERRKAYMRWLIGLAPWSSMISLTFRETKPVDSAKAWYRKLVRELNESVLGKRYRRIVDESYFSYAMGLEYQSRGVPHFHVLVDRPVDFALIHEKWGNWVGFAWTDVIKHPLKAIRYVVKYAVKHGDLDVYIAKWKGEPIVQPKWWKQWGSSDTDLLHG
jgi:hypothetical protein